MHTTRATAVAALALAAATAFSNTPAQADWDIHTMKNEMDDTAIITAFATSDENVEGTFGLHGPASLFVRCMEGRTDVYFTMAEAFLADIPPFGNVDVRVDKEKPRTVQMNVSTDNKSLGLWRGQGVKLLKSMAGKKKLTIRAAAYNESQQVMVFSLAGFDAALTKVRTACKW